MRDTGGIENSKGIELLRDTGRISILKGSSCCETPEELFILKGSSLCETTIEFDREIIRPIISAIFLVSKDKN
jgi:hypothetical protein